MYKCVFCAHIHFIKMDVSIFAARISLEIQGPFEISAHETGQVVDGEKRSWENPSPPPIWNLGDPQG